MEAHKEVLLGCLDGEVEALQQRKAEYDEERRLSDGSDSCWSCSGSGSGSEAVPEVDIGPPTLEGAVVVAAQGRELEGGAQGPLQSDGRAPAVLGKRVQMEEGPLHPRGLAPKRMRDETMSKDGRGEQQQRGGGREREGAGGRGQSNGKWSMSGFNVDPGGAVLVAGRYTVKAVQSQVTLQGTAGRETWLGVDLLRGGGKTKVTGRMQSVELQRRAAGDADWLARLRGRGREGWGVEGHS